MNNVMVIYVVMEIIYSYRHWQLKHLMATFPLLKTMKYFYFDAINMYKLFRFFIV